MGWESGWSRYSCYYSKGWSDTKVVVKALASPWNRKAVDPKICLAWRSRKLGWVRGSWKRVFTANILVQTFLPFTLLVPLVDNEVLVSEHARGSPPSDTSDTGSSILCTLASWWTTVLWISLTPVLLALGNEGEETIICRLKLAAWVPHW